MNRLLATLPKLARIIFVMEVQRRLQSALTKDAIANDELIQVKCCDLAVILVAVARMAGEELDNYVCEGFARAAETVKERKARDAVN